MKVLVVGLNPSIKGGNSPTIKNLYKWLDVLQLKYVSFINLYDDYGSHYKTPNQQFIKEISVRYDRVLCLGRVVSNTLRNMDIDCFDLPHPSGLNRQLNNVNYVHERLEACKNYLYRR